MKVFVKFHDSDRFNKIPNIIELSGNSEDTFNFNINYSIKTRSSQIEKLINASDVRDKVRFKIQLDDGNYYFNSVLSPSEFEFVDDNIIRKFSSQIVGGIKIK